MTLHSYIFLNLVVLLLKINSKNTLKYDKLLLILELLAITKMGSDPKRSPIRD